MQLNAVFNEELRPIFSPWHGRGMVSREGNNERTCVRERVQHRAVDGAFGEMTVTFITWVLIASYC